MSSRRLQFIGVAAAVGLTLGINFVQHAGADEGVTVGLHNTTAGEAECPGSVTGDAWHFVAPPKSATDFLHITLVLHNDATSVDDVVPIADESWISDPLQGDAYVLVPAGYSIDSLVDGTFVITGSTQEVRLSHTCGGGEEETPPDVTVTKTADVTFDQDYQWSIVKRVVNVVPHTTNADINYAIDVTKSGPYPVGGSYVVTGTITVTNNEEAGGGAAEISNLVENGLTTTGATCSLDQAFAPVVIDAATSQGFDYTCTGIAGVPTGSDTNTATATLEFGLQSIDIPGTVDFDWAGATVDQTTDDTATLTDPVLNITQQYSASGTQFGTKWALPAGGSNCDPGFTNVATITEDDSGDFDDDSVTVHLCTTVNGHTIGYWFASPQGGAQTYATFPTLKGLYPNVLGSVSFPTAKKVKEFGQAANCSGDCKTMLQAQFIATAMSTQTVSGFGAQCIYVPTWISGTGQITISGLLTFIDSGWIGFSTPQRVELKSILDAINNNQTLACIV